MFWPPTKTAAITSAHETSTCWPPPARCRPACDSAIFHGATEVEPIFASLLGTLEKEGLARMHPEGEEFDPTFHEAVLHEGGDGGETIVAEVIRSGYTWKGRVLRPAMVKVKG